MEAILNAVSDNFVFQILAFATANFLALLRYSYLQYQDSECTDRFGAICYPSTLNYMAEDGLRKELDQS